MSEQGLSVKERLKLFEKSDANNAIAARPKSPDLSNTAVPFARNATINNNQDGRPTVKAIVGLFAEPLNVDTRSSITKAELLNTSPTSTHSIDTFKILTPALSSPGNSRPGTPGRVTSNNLQSGSSTPALSAAPISSDIDIAALNTAITQDLRTSPAQTHTPTMTLHPPSPIASVASYPPKLPVRKQSTSSLNSNASITVFPPIGTQSPKLPPRKAQSLSVPPSPTSPVPSKPSNHTPTLPPRLQQTYPPLAPNKSAIVKASSTKAQENHIEEGRYTKLSTSPASNHDQNRKQRLKPIDTRARKRYETLFHNLVTSKNSLMKDELPGAVVAVIWKRSGLSNLKLKDIWSASLVLI